MLLTDVKIYPTAGIISKGHIADKPAMFIPRTRLEPSITP